MRALAELKKEVFRNLAITLSFDLDRYIIQHPRFGDRIPQGAVVVFHINGNNDFNRWMMESARKGKEKGKPIVIIEMGKKPRVLKVERDES